LKRHKANDRLAPPLIKPDGRFSRIRLSEGHSLASLLRSCLGPRRPRGQPIQTVAFPENVPWVRLALGVGFNVRIVPPALSFPPAHAKPKELEPFLPHVERPGFPFVEREAMRFEPSFEPRQQLRPLPRSGQDDKVNASLMGFHSSVSALLHLGYGPIRLVEITFCQWPFTFNLRAELPGYS
jgi:hypothetical protein